MLYKQAMIFLEKGDPKKSLVFLKQALEVDKNYLPAWNNMGVVLLELQDYPKALECFDAVIRLDLSDNMAWYNKGYVHLILKEYQASVQSFDIFLARRPDEDDFRKFGFYLQAQGYYELKKYKESLKSIEKAIKMDNNFKEALKLQELVKKSM
ncbi:MAG TPA: tetratricopeptide repeat protein [Methanobacteriaceae archaeon]|nr:tetratricopeptide repeat protein [Methanobacteriaceae archaeon]